MRQLKNREIGKKKGGSSRRVAAVTFFFVAFLSIHCMGQKLPSYDGYRFLFRVMEWNVENLFDTRHDTLKEDEEFLPTAIRHWSYSKYRKKLTDVARVIIAAGEWTPPALIGLCEVENERVLNDLVLYSPLKNIGYRYVMTNSPDLRGIDVALLYRRDMFKLLSFRSLSVSPLESRRPTRDILHACGQVLTGDTLDVFVCHFPSRYNGAKESEPDRIRAARILREASDSILHARLHPQVIIMGDFNDYPSNRSIREILEAEVVPCISPSDSTTGSISFSPVPSVSPLRLYHLLARKALKKNYGSYKYRGRWKLIDHLIVSGTLLDTSTEFYTTEEDADVFCLPFLLKEDKRYSGKEPFRTYKGMKYQGGISDHLPVYADFTVILEKGF